MEKARKAIRKAIKYKALDFISCYVIERDRIDAIKNKSEEHARAIALCCWQEMHDL